MITPVKINHRFLKKIVNYHRALKSSVHTMETEIYKIFLPCIGSSVPDLGQMRPCAREVMRLLKETHSHRLC